MPTAFDEEIKLLEKWKTKDPSVHRRFAEWRRKWKIMGPVAFAHEVLKVDPETGDPLTLSEDQKKWLLDVTKRGVRFTIIVAGRGCLAKGTLIQMEDGSYKPIEKIKMGDRVVSTDDGITTRIKTVVGVYNNGLKEVFLLKNSIGGKIIGTEDHLFLTNAKKKIIWQPLSYFKQSNSRMPKTIKLRIGSYDVKDYPISDSRIVFLAWLISEGNYTSTPKITNTNYACLKECEEIARNEFNVNPKYYSKGNGWDLICSNDFNKTRPRVGFRGSPKSKLIRWLEEIGIYGQKKEMKEIPNFLFKCSNRQIKLFLETFRLGDGNLYERKGKRKGQLLITLYAGLSLTLAKQLCLLFNRLGIYPNIKLHHGYEVYMADKKSRQYLNSKYDDVAYGLKKESLGKKEVWDIEVDSGLPCFLTNGGFFAHNSGKTFVLAVYVTWRIFTHEFWGVSCMGGSAEQSEKIHKYVSYWVREQSELNSYCLKYTTKKISTYCDSYVRFLSCSETSVRGPHVVELIIDEQAAGEQRGGTKTMKATIGQVSTSKDIHIHKSSTAQFIQGDFIDTWNNAKKLGYKRYRWSIAKHKSGEDDPYRIYQDINPNNWISNVPWILDQNVKILRDNWSDDEWLVEALGGIGSASGLVFDPNDLTACICSRCLDENKPCEPYKNGYCPIIQYYMQLEGSPSDKIPLDTKKALRKIGRRTEGVDWGKKSPCAYTATGKYRRAVFVLHSEEEVIGGDADKIQKAIDIAEKWNIDVIRPDPREWAYNNAIAEKGFAVHQLFTGATGDVEKNKYLFVLKRLVERHLIIIPCIFEDLIRSLRSATYDDKGRIRKHKDHSLDSLIYAVSYYDEVSDQTAFWKAIRGEVIEEEMTEEEQETIKKQKEENVKRTGDEDIRIIDDWEEYVKKRKWKKEEEREGEGEFPWGEGADMW